MLVKTIRKTPIALAVSAALFIASQNTALADIVPYNSPLHVFSVDDVQGGFDGSTFGTSGAVQDTSIICDIAGGPACPPGYGPVQDKQGVTLYPTDTEFGFYVVDFLGAQGKIRDNKYEEGFVGNIVEEGVQTGIKVANAPTLKYKVKPPLGTWCQGLGATSVKCETEHYVVMEHVLSCHETIPYSFANYITGVHDILSTPDGSLTFDCADAPLDDNAIVLVDGAPTLRLTDPTPCEAVDDPAGCQMFPNDKTDTRNNLALSSDYSVQLKDDGKPLYGWGGIHKRPNDVRMYAKLALPPAWKAPQANFAVTKAQLVVNHWITNNPNDQLRPEDLENEGATGRKPSYRIEGTPGGADEVWKSLEACYEGDGDLIDTEEGLVDPSFIGVGTVLRNVPFALSKAATPGTAAEDDPYAISSDLYGGFTNAYYTTINREPFEWAYDSDPDPLIQDFVSSPVPNDALGEFISGPRWRLKPGKFGQDLPALEVPLIECSKPPFKSDNIKYDVGTPTTTIINLLDWDAEGEGAPSPLSTSAGWVDVTQNDFVTVAGTNNGVPYSTNGLPMTDDFDLAVYVKGDSKSTSVFNAQLVIEYDDTPVIGTDPTAVNDTASVACGGSVPIDVLGNDTDPEDDTLTVTGFTDPANGTVTRDGIDNNLLIYTSDGACGIEDTFTYDISDGNGGTDTATVAVTVADEGGAYDLSITELNVPESVFKFRIVQSSITIRNDGPETISGDVAVTGASDVNSQTTDHAFSFTNLAAGQTKTFYFSWFAYFGSYTNPGNVNWTATVTPTSDDSNTTNNTVTAVTEIL